MSILYRFSEETLWNPSNRVAALFNGQVELASKVFGVASGLSEVIEDEVYIELADYQQFVERILFEYDRSTHKLLRAMTVGFLAPASVLLQRAGGTLPVLEFAHTSLWTQQTNEASKLMPR